MKYLKNFNTETEYTTFRDSDAYILPNVSYIIADDKVIYGISKTEEGEYKVIIISKKDISGLTYNAVDLGLPSGILWADRNVGATSPEEYGTYFAWGETEGFASNGIKNVSASELAKLIKPCWQRVCENEGISFEEPNEENIENILNKLVELEYIETFDKDLASIGSGFSSEKCFSGDYSDYFDTTDGGKTFNKYFDYKYQDDRDIYGESKLEKVDDAARVNMGGDWCMPESLDVRELLDNTTITYVDANGIEYNERDASDIPIFKLKGIKFTGANGNSIMFPTAGSCSNSKLGNAGSKCYIYTCRLSGDYDSMCYVLDAGHNRYYDPEEGGYIIDGCDAVLNTVNRSNGMSVRGVIRAE